jgi:hypothetical protein
MRLIDKNTKRIIRPGERLRSALGGKVTFLEITMPPRPPKAGVLPRHGTIRIRTLAGKPYLCSPAVYNAEIVK